MSTSGTNSSGTSARRRPGPIPPTTSPGWSRLPNQPEAPSVGFSARPLVAAIRSRRQGQRFIAAAAAGIDGRPRSVAAQSRPRWRRLRDDRTRRPSARRCRVQHAAWFLDYHCGTLRLKANGLDREPLAATHPPSTLSLGGLMKHMALVEEHWLSAVLLGDELGAPWAGIDWEADPH